MQAPLETHRTEHVMINLHALAHTISVCTGRNTLQSCLLCITTCTGTSNRAIPVLCTAKVLGYKHALQIWRRS